MTPLQNNSQQRQREAKHGTYRVTSGPDPRPDSESFQQTLQKSGLVSKFGPHNFDFTSNFGPGWGHHDGGTKVDTGPAESHAMCNRQVIKNPIQRALLEEPRINNNNTRLNNNISAVILLQAVARLLRDCCKLLRAVLGLLRKVSGRLRTASGLLRTVSGLLWTVANNY
jgi:hypothetical protein